MEVQVSQHAITAGGLKLTIRLPHLISHPGQRFLPEKDRPAAITTVLVVLLLIGFGILGILSRDLKASLDTVDEDMVGEEFSVLGTFTPIHIPFDDGPIKIELFPPDIIVSGRTTDVHVSAPDPGEITWSLVPPPDVSLLIWGNGSTYQAIYIEPGDDTEWKGTGTMVASYPGEEDITLPLLLSTMRPKKLDVDQDGRKERFLDLYDILPGIDDGYETFIDPEGGLVSLELTDTDMDGHIDHIIGSGRSQEPLYLVDPDDGNVDGLILMDTDGDGLREAHVDHDRDDVIDARVLLGPDDVPGIRYAAATVFPDYTGLSDPHAIRDFPANGTDEELERILDLAVAAGATTVDVNIIDPETGESVFANESILDILHDPLVHYVDAAHERGLEVLLFIPVFNDPAYWEDHPEERATTRMDRLRHLAFIQGTDVNGNGSADILVDDVGYDPPDMVTLNADGIDNDGDGLIDEPTITSPSGGTIDGDLVLEGGLPIPIDTDGDGSIDEDPYDLLDNDGDGLIDEDGHDLTDHHRGWVSPGSGDHIAWKAQVARDIVDTYGLDGVMLDYVRYPVYHVFGSRFTDEPWLDPGYSNDIVSGFPNSTTTPVDPMTSFQDPVNNTAWSIHRLSILGEAVNTLVEGIDPDITIAYVHIRTGDHDDLVGDNTILRNLTAPLSSYSGWDEDIIISGSGWDFGPEHSDSGGHHVLITPKFYSWYTSTLRDGRLPTPFELQYELPLAIWPTPPFQNDGSNITAPGDDPLLAGSIMSEWRWRGTGVDPYELEPYPTLRRFWRPYWLTSSPENITLAHGEITPVDRSGGISRDIEDLLVFNEIGLPGPSRGGTTVTLEDIDNGTLQVVVSGGDGGVVRVHHSSKDDGDLRICFTPAVEDGYRRCIIDGRLILPGDGRYNVSFMTHEEPGWTSKVGDFLGTVWEQGRIVFTRTWLMLREILMPAMWQWALVGVGAIILSILLGMRFGNTVGVDTEPEGKEGDPDDEGGEGTEDEGRDEEGPSPDEGTGPPPPESTTLPEVEKERPVRATKKPATPAKIGKTTTTKKSVSPRKPKAPKNVVSPRKLKAPKKVKAPGKPKAPKKVKTRKSSPPPPPPQDGTGVTPRKPGPKA